MARNRIRTLLSAPRGRALLESIEPRLLFAGTGLAGTYFDDMELTDPVSVRLDPAIDFNWADRSPTDGVAPNTYSVRWDGQLRPEFSETYTFHTTGNDGVRLWVNGVLLVDDWNEPSCHREHRLDRPGSGSGVRHPDGVLPELRDGRR